MEKQYSTNQNHSGSGDNIARDKVINTYLHTKDYQELVFRLTDLHEQKAILEAKIIQYPDDEDFAVQLLKVDGQIDLANAQIESFKNDVFRLYETFTKIPIDSERLKLAKAHFEKGEFREADAILKAEDIKIEVSSLKAAKLKKENELAEINTNLDAKATEYLIKAQLWQTFYNEPDWFEKSAGLYEMALDAARLVEIIYEYALFLYKHNQFDQAQSLYEEALQKYRVLAVDASDKYLPVVATILNDLALLQYDCNELEAASGNYEEALRINRSLAESNPQIYLPEVAGTLNNLATLQESERKFDLAIENYKKALLIYKGLSKDAPLVYLPDEAMVLNNIANVQRAQEKYGLAVTNYNDALKIKRFLAKDNTQEHLTFLAGTLSNLGIAQRLMGRLDFSCRTYEEALQIYKVAAKENSQMYLPDLAMTLGNLANLQRDLNQLDLALMNYNETLKLYRNLAKDTPQVYLPNVAGTLVNLGIFSTAYLPDKEKAVEYSKEVLKIILPLYQDVPYLQGYVQVAKEILQANGVNWQDVIKP